MGDNIKKSYNSIIINEAEAQITKEIDYES